MRRICLAFTLALAIVGSADAQQRELTPAEQVAHVLSRLTFGARSGDADRVAVIGVDRWISDQLRPHAIDDDTVTTALASLPPWARPISELASLSNLASLVRPAATKADTVIMRTMGDSARRMTVAARVRFVSLLSGIDQFAAGKVIHAQVSERQLLEVITDFWENHFSVFSGKMPTRDALYVFDRDVIRPRALGKFRDLLGAVAHSPAMLFYLDNHVSTKAGLNENYARELLELHTLGVDGGYTQQDVIDVARALTGWTFAPPIAAPARAGVPVKFVFNEDVHDPAEKKVLGRTLRAGRGVEEGEEVLDILARHPATARFISLKLARRLVSDEPPRALVDRAAATFTRTGGDITEVVRTIVTSPEFFSRAAFRAKTKTPFEYIVSVNRALNAPPDTSLATAQLLTQFGQATFGRQSPDGWPDYASAWVNAGAMMRRVMFGADVAAGRMPTVPVDRWEGWSLLSMSPEHHQAEGVIRLLLGGIVPAETRAALLAADVSAKPNEFRDAPQRLREMVAVALGSPEFQRR